MYLHRLPENVVEITREHFDHLLDVCNWTRSESPDNADIFTDIKTGKKLFMSFDEKFYVFTD